jgi:hypothetical protein
MGFAIATITSTSNHVLGDNQKRDCVDKNAFFLTTVGVFACVAVSFAARFFPTTTTTANALHLFSSKRRYSFSD